MRKYIDLKGKRFGKLYVIERNTDVKRKNVVWRCKCDCGNIVNVETRDLRERGKTSCGCDRKRASNFEDLSGKKFGRLTVIKEIGFINNRVRWECLCDCGNVCQTTTHDLKSGKKKSCGCLKHDKMIEVFTTHGLSKERIHKEWRGILHRCKNPSASHYENYGGRGIEVCEEWKGENGFINFCDWAMENGYSDDLTLDRIDNDKGYSPDNCRWVTHMENCHNRGVRKDSVTGCAGVNPRENKNGTVVYRAYITTNYKRTYLGKFDTLEEAVSARKAAEDKYWGKKEGDLNE